MANPGGLGSKFVSVNLNKSYGKPPNSYSHASTSPASRLRSTSNGGGSRMVVLSRPRNAVSGGSKSGPRLSVPPPLNLPSLRKEHERLDLVASGGSAGVGAVGSMSGHGSTATGWSKPAFLEKDGTGARPGDDAASTGPREFPNAAARMPQAPFMETAVALRGEDFPSLRATLVSSNTAQAHRQKCFSKQKNNLSSGVSDTGDSNSGSQIQMRPQMHSSHSCPGLKSDANGDSGRSSGDGGRVSRQSQKEEGLFLGPLPIVRLSHTREWADDERDTGHSFSDRGRDYGRELVTSRNGASVTHNNGFFDGQLFDVGAGKMVPRVDSHRRDVRTPSSEGRQRNSGVFSQFQKEWFGPHDLDADANRTGRGSLAVSGEMNKDTRKNYVDLSYNSNKCNGSGSIGPSALSSRANERNSGFGLVKQNLDHMAELSTRKEWEHKAGIRLNTSLNQHGRDTSQSSTVAENFFPVAQKRFSLTSPIRHLSGERHLAHNSRKFSVDDNFGITGFKGRDYLSGALVFKKKKDVVRQADFHDPVRESFEAELERVQKMQEQERQRIAEEQARALEVARKEEEERQKRIREDEERRKRLEEDEREAAWRAEQERLEALKWAEEQRIAREEEKRRLFMEEERRKESARQKLLELEARIARRQSESMKNDKADEKLMQKDAQRIPEVRYWEDGERMVERFTSSASSDSSGLNRANETGSRFQPSRNGSNASVKCTTPWRKNTVENGSNSIFLSHEQAGHYPRRGLSDEAKELSRKDFFEIPRLSKRKGRIPEHNTVDGFIQFRDKRWDMTMESDHQSRKFEIESEFSDATLDKFSEIRWSQDRSKSISCSADSDKFFHNALTDGFPSLGRSRYSMRQPRVLPPPSMTSMQHHSVRGHSEYFQSSMFLDDEIRHSHVRRRNENLVKTMSECENLERAGQTKHVAPAAEDDSSPQEHSENLQRCNSQSSLSVSSPPSSCVHLSQDDLDELKESLDRPAGQPEQLAFSDNECGTPPVDGELTNIMKPGSPSSREEEWVIENAEELQIQEESDEEERINEETREVQENVQLTCDVADLQLEEENVDGKMETFILGFNEGVEVQVSGGAEDSQNEDNMTTVQQEGSTGDAVSIKLIEPDDTLKKGCLNSLAKIEETGKVIDDLTLHGEPTNSGIPANQLPVTISVGSTKTVEPVQPCYQQPITSSIPSHSEVSPVQMQFGLFSGPSLIPSPVPAIQIGSIQMPLQLHTPVGPLSQIHPSQQSFFQFGQFRYTSPISQGILHLSPQAVPLMQPTVSSHYSLNQLKSGSAHNQMGQDSHSRENISSVSPSIQPGMFSDGLNPFPMVIRKNISVANKNIEKEGPSQRHQDNHLFGENKMGLNFSSQAEAKRHHGRNPRKSYRSAHVNGLSRSQPSQSFSDDRPFRGSKNSGTAAGRKGKKFGYTVRRNSRYSYFMASEVPHAEPSNLSRRYHQRVRRSEFRLQENVDQRESEVLPVKVLHGPDEKFNSHGKHSASLVNSGAAKIGSLNMTSRTESGNYVVSGISGYQNGSSESKTGKATRKEVSLKKQTTIVKKTNFHGSPKEDEEPPLQSGIVCVFKQPGIEAPSDEDDFIEVRSKRQLLNDRREQREKELRAKSRVIKAPRKACAAPQAASIPSNFVSKISSSSSGGLTAVVSATGTDGNASAAHNTSDTELPIIHDIASSSSPLVGTLAINADSMNNLNSKISVHTIHPTGLANVGASIMPSSSLQAESPVSEEALSSLDVWAHSGAGQQAKVQTCDQNNEVVNSECFDAYVTHVNEHTSTVMEPSKPPLSALSQGNQQSSSSCPLDSLLMGDIIQFGAVTSLSLLPPTCAVSDSIGPTVDPVEVLVDKALSASEAGRTGLFDQNKHFGASCVHLDDAKAEAEAEAAASAIAVAAISNDELTGITLSLSDTKNYECSGSAALGASQNQQSVPQLKGDDLLTVSLPADLSVETPPLSLWPPLQSQQNMSNPVLPPFHGAPAFSCYEMSSVLGGPIFAFGPHDVSSNDQAQPKNDSTSSVPPPGTWQRYSGADSYCPPTGFPGPFISPGGIPGMQGSPHMVVYNHFAPVGQYGQVGLGFMEASCIPSAKQRDWRHTPISTSESKIGNLNMVPVPGQRPATNASGHIPHIPSGSALMPLPSPLAMFDMSAFQPSVDMPMQSPWQHVPAQTLQSVPLPTSIWQQGDGTILHPFKHLDGEPAAVGKRFNGARSLSPRENSKNFSPEVETSSSQFHNELGLVESAASSANPSPSRPGSTSRLQNKTQAEKGGGATIGSDSSSSLNGDYTVLGEQQNPGYAHPTKEKKGTGTRMFVGDWHRRLGFQGRIQGSGGDKNSSGASKMKQVYVAKPAPTSGPVIAR